MNKILTSDFFNKKVTYVAENLIGKFLVRKIGNEEIAVMITEVEAYDGPNDLACHGRFGKTKRTQAMYLDAGYFYIYMIYGMYWMLNIVTGPKDYPAAVLIRGIKNLVGPGRLTKFLKIDQTFNQKIVAPTSFLWVEDHAKQIKSNEIIKTPRIGINYAGPIWSKKLYRFVLKSN
ncbi:DNA-3-methyladenine glycosylase [Candidatus Dependentiae bacterium]|nr:DNA-3-methyladenine glycosylase [Candidatus Dependentiae bacterium]